MTGQNIIIAMVALVVLGAGAWWFMDGLATQESVVVEENKAVENAEENNDTAESRNFSGQGTFAELAQSGQALECHFTFADTEVSGEGTGYFADEMARVNSEIRQDGTTYISSYIMRDETMYMWADSPQGQFAIQMSVNETDSEFVADTDAPISPDETVDYNCQPWSVDTSVFTVPTDIEFMDMAAMMQGFEGMDQAEMEAMMQMSQ